MMERRGWTEEIRRLRSQLRKEPRVAALGFLGVGLGVLCAGWGVARGFSVVPEGNLWETATFNGAVGIFLLTLAVLAPEAGFSERGQRRWAWALVPLTLYSYGIETVQAFRGLDPRFSSVAGPTDQLLGLAFFLAALAIMGLFVVFAWRFFVASPTPLRVAVRYASVAALVSFGVGIWMSVINGRAVGAEGNLLLIHAAGFHGLQAVPLVAYLLERAGVPRGEAAPWIHGAGIAWTGLCLAVLWQAASGRGPMEVTPGLVWASIFLAGWVVTVLAALRALRRPRTVPA